MNLQELHESKKTKVVKRALRENFELDIDFDSLDFARSQNMLRQVRAALSTARQSRAIHESQNRDVYLKLVMMEQGLSDRVRDLRYHRANIIVENEEVQKSQVILASQDMIDSIQKMLEDVSKMKVEELNAVVDGIKNEFGSNEGDQFSQAVTEALGQLEQALSTAKQALSGAQGGLTGEGGGMPGGAGPDLGGIGGEPGGEPDQGAQPGGDLGGIGDLGGEPSGELPELPEPEPEEETGPAGRERR
jgi:hypothetical protein